MAICDRAHGELDRIADGPLQVGPLPGWARVRGNAAWWVARGPTETLGPAWRRFHQEVGAARPGRPDGPPGDVFVCRPEDHAGDGERSILTILYVPLA